MEKLKKKPLKCIRYQCGACCNKMTAERFGVNPEFCPNYKYAPALYQKKETFEAIGIYVRAKINRLCNENKHDEAIKLKEALEIIMSQDYDY